MWYAQNYPPSPPGSTVSRTCAKLLAARAGPPQSYRTATCSGPRIPLSSPSDSAMVTPLGSNVAWDQAAPVVRAESYNAYARPPDHAPLSSTYTVDTPHGCAHDSPCLAWLHFVARAAVREEPPDTPDRPLQQFANDCSSAKVAPPLGPPYCSSAIITTNVLANPQQQQHTVPQQHAVPKPERRTKRICAYGCARFMGGGPPHDRHPSFCGVAGLPCPCAQGNVVSAQDSPGW